MGGKLFWFGAGVAAYWLYEHFGPAPKMNAGKYSHG